MKPATLYTKSGRINIAYQVFGSGPIDLVYIPGWVSKLFTVSNKFRSPLQANETSMQPMPKNSSFLEDVLHCIDNHLNDELFGVEVLCREIGVSERQLQRKLKAITNKSPNQLITSVRLHRAKELLQNPDYNIAEIAFQTGFSNPSYFSRIFKKEFGVSPSSFLQKQFVHSSQFIVHSL